MSKLDKLLARLAAMPKDFTWDELKTILDSLGYTMKKGNGSRRKFIHNETLDIINLHEPHPQKVLKPYALKQVVEKLKANDLM
jgi:hypothetical protein